MIKKFLSITTIALMLTAVLQISVATHYCGGMIAASKVSLSGKVATCGMESHDIQMPATGLIFSTHCCDNVVRRYGVTQNYFPSFTSVPESFQQHLQPFTAPELQFSNTLASLINPTSESPPVITNSSQVDLSEICIFRI
jgi:hypothetical protein